MNYRKVVSDAVKDVAAHGYDSPERIARWVSAIGESARDSLVSEKVLEAQLSLSLEQTYRRLIGQRAILRNHYGVETHILDKVQYELRRELEKRILSASALIQGSRDLAVKEATRRFQAWATSLPEGGRKTDTAAATQAILKYLKNLPLVDRRVLSDQSHKLEASLSQVLAVAGGALGGYWASNWRQPGYDYREDHRDRDLEFFVLRGNWAMVQGFMKLAGHKYTDGITAPGEEPHCRCKYRWVYGLAGVPPGCLTKKGALAVGGLETV